MSQGLKCISQALGCMFQALEYISHDLGHKIYRDVITFVPSRSILLCRDVGLITL